MLPMWYNIFVSLATFFFLPAAVLMEDGAIPPMPVLNVVLPIPSPSLLSAFPCFPFLNSFPCHTFEITTVVDRRPRTGERQTLRRYFTYPLSVQLLAHSFARRKKQLSSFQSLPHSLPKTTGGGGIPFLLSSRLASPEAHWPLCGHHSHELYPKARRNPHRLRASLLGRQHHGNLRASLLLRCIRLTRQLSPRKAEFSHRADRHARRNLRRYGLVSRDFWRGDRRPPRIPPRALAGLLDSCDCLFSARFHRRSVARSGQSRRSAGGFRWLHSNFACARHFHGETLRGGNNRARLQGKRPLHRLLHLLHHGEHRRRLRPVRRFVGAPPSRRRECFPRRRAQRLPDVFRRLDFLPRTQAHRRRSATQRFRNVEEFSHRSRQSKIHALSADLHRLLDCLLAAVHLASRLHSWLHQRRRRRRAYPHHRRPLRHLPHPGHQLLDSQAPRVPVRYPRDAYHFAFLADSRLSAHRPRRGPLHFRSRPRRNDPGPALLRIHLPPRASRAARHLHGLCFFAHRHRFAHRRMVRRARHAPVWRSRAPASARLVGHFRGGRSDRSIALDLRPHRQTNWPGSNWVKGMNLENRRRFFLTKNLN